MKRRKSYLEELGEFMEAGFAAVDEFGGPIMQCIAYKKGKSGQMRCAQFLPTIKGGDDPNKWIIWSAKNREMLKEPYKYYYKKYYLTNREKFGIPLKKRGRKKITKEIEKKLMSD